MTAWADGLLGAIMGASASGVHSIDEESKWQKLREEREAKKKDELDLEQKKLEMRDKMQEARAEAERQRMASFVSKNKLPDQEIQGVEVDESGKEIGKIKGEGPADSRAQIEKYAREAPTTGDKGIIEWAFKERDAIRKDDSEEAKVRRDEERNALARAAEERKERERLGREELGYARLEAAMARAASGNGGEKDSAKIRETNFLAQTKFGGDPKGDPAKYREALTKAADIVFARSESDYTTTSKESYDEQGNKVTTTQRVKAGKEQPATGMTFTGKYTKDGKRIMQDANGKKFVE